MKINLIYWEAPFNRAQAVSGEKYPHYALLLKTSGDTNLVLFYTHEKQMVITTISEKKTGFVKIAKLEVPYEILEDVMRYIDTQKSLQGFADTFLSFVDKHRKKIDRVDDIIAKIDGKKSPADILFDQFFNKIPQPFPRQTPPKL